MKTQFNIKSIFWLLLFNLLGVGYLSINFSGLKLVLITIVFVYLIIGSYVIYLVSKKE